MNEYEEMVFLEAFGDELEKIALSPALKARAYRRAKNLRWGLFHEKPPVRLRDAVDRAYRRRTRQARLFAGSAPMGTKDIASAREALNVERELGFRLPRSNKK